MGTVLVSVPTDRLEAPSVMTVRGVTRGVTPVQRLCP